MSQQPSLPPSPDNGNRSTLRWMLFWWFALGQILMIFLLFAPPSATLSRLADAVSKILPMIESVRSLPVFNPEIARVHLALVWVLSPIFFIVSCCIPIPTADAAMMPKRKTQMMFLVFLPFVAGIVSFFGDFYVGGRTFGIYKVSLGFALLSSFWSALIPLSMYLARIMAENDADLL